MIVVADAGPILHLHWIGCLSWGLPATKVHVVEQVWLEITQHAPQALADPLEAARAGRATVAEARLALESLPNQGRLHVTRELLARAIAALESGT